MSTDTAQDAVDEPIQEPIDDSAPADSLPEPPSDDTPPSLLDRLAAQGVDVSKYQDEDAAITGIASAIQMLGRKTQDAKRTAEELEALKTRLGDEGLARLLDGHAPDEPAPNGKPEREIISAAQLAQWRTLYESNSLPEEDKRKFSQRLLELEAVANDIANGDVPASLMPMVDAMLEDRFEKFRQEHSQSTAAQQAEAAERQAAQEFWGEHSKEIFLDPEAGEDGGLTPLGQKIQKLYSSHPKLAKMPAGIDRLALAYELAAPSPTPVKEPQKAAPAAKHQPGTKAEPVKRDRKSFVAKYGRNPSLHELAVWKGEVKVPET